MKRIRTMCLGAIFTVCLLAGCGASASESAKTEDTAGSQTNQASATSLDYPKRNINVIVPFAAGGGTDLTARGFLNVAEKYAGAKFLITNVTGSGGWAGWQQVLAEDADGYTLALVTINVFTDSGTELTYKDFTPLATLSRYPTVYAVPVDSEIQTIADLVSAAEANPGGLRVAVGGIDDVDHINSRKFEELTGTSFAYVPYNGGAESIAAALGGNVDIVVCNTPEIAGRDDMRVLSVWADERLATLPDVPTMKEEGYDIVVTRFRSLAAPADTPEDVLSFLEDIFAETANDPDWLEYANSISAEPDYMDRKATEEYLDQMNVAVNGN